MATEQTPGGSSAPPEDDLPLHEHPDGSVTIGDVSAQGAEDDHEDEDERPVTGGAGTVAEQQELAQAATEDEREAIRARRRQERKDKQQRARDREDNLRTQLAAAQRANQALSERMGLIERKTSGSELAQLDNAINQAGQAYEAFKSQVGEAVTRQDGQAVAEFTERMVIARERQRELTNIRQQYTTQPQRTAPPLDPDLVRHAQKWMADNKWYDPQGKDVDSRIALTLDKALADEGYAPNTERYWQELSTRVGKYLPHRASPGTPEPGILPANDTAARNKPSRNVVTGSGREASTGNTGGAAYTLSPDRVQALKDAGMWNDVKQRNDMIRQYRDYDRKTGSSGRT